MIQISLFITIITVGYMIDAIIRIFRSVQDNRKLIMDESYMLFHILAFLIYILNLAVADVLFVRNEQNSNLIPGRAFQYTGIAVMVTGFMSQIFLLLIIRKQVGCLRLVKKQE